MIDRTDKLASPPVDSEEIAQSRLVPQLRMMIAALWAARVRNTLLALAVGIFLTVVATAYGQIRLNSWNKPFYDALAHRELKEFLEQLGVFAVIAGALLALNVGQRWLTEMMKLKLRQGLVHDLVEHWLQPGRAFRLANAGAIGVNPDQRMHEDARHLTELSADLGVGLLQASILLITFINVLWALSNGFAFHIGGRDIVIPGYMVWAAVVYSGSASLVSYWVGRNLISRNSERYAREADLRFSLVRVNEHIDAIALAAGEADEARRIEVDFAAVLVAMRRLVTGVTNLTWITAGYGWFTLVAPIIAAAPLYFAGNLTFGGLMLASGAFMQVQSSLRWFVDNFSTIADWRATLLRVASFRRAVVSIHEMHEVEGRIAFSDGEASTFSIDDLVIASPAGCTKLQERHVELKPAERVLIVGETGAARTLLFRALTGLWPWGSGRIARPKGAAILSMPRTAYLPPGTLREVLAYPSGGDQFDAKAVAQALDRLDLQRLVPMLEETRNWDREVSEEEARGIQFARVLLHAPAWVLIDEVLGNLDAATLKRAVDVFANELAHTGVIYIGSPDADEHLFGRVLHLIKDADSRKLAPYKPAEASLVS
jgi:putative ATP-binding cassette transporter